MQLKDGIYLNVHRLGISANGHSEVVDEHVHSKVMTTIYHNIQGNKTVMIKNSLPGSVDEVEKFRLNVNEILVCSPWQEIHIVNDDDTVSHHLHMSWQVLPKIGCLSDERLVSRLMTYLNYSYQRCGLKRQQQDSTVSKVLAIRTALMRNLVLAGNTKITKSIAFPYHILSKELWEYHVLSMANGIKQVIDQRHQNFDSCIFCVTCGMDLFHSYFQSSNESAEKKICCGCMQKFVVDENFRQTSCQTFSYEKCEDICLFSQNTDILRILKRTGILYRGFLPLPRGFMQLF